MAPSEGGSDLRGQCLPQRAPRRGGAELRVRPCCHRSPVAARASVELLAMPNACRVWPGPWVTRPGLGRWSRGDAEAPVRPPLPLPSRASRVPTGPGGGGAPGGGGGGSPSPPRFAATPKCHLQNPLPRRAPRPRGRSHALLCPGGSALSPGRRRRGARVALGQTLRVWCVLAAELKLFRDGPPPS